MSLTTLDQAKLQLRVTTADEDALYQIYLDAAERWVSEYCNRFFYPDTDTQATAVAAVAATLDTAEATWKTARENFGFGCHTESQRIQMEAADAVFAQACADARKTYYSAAPPPPQFTQAVLLLISSSDANREALFTAMPTAVDPPFGVTDLLFSLRSQLGV
jgi:hypothetical protein